MSRPGGVFPPDPHNADRGSGKYGCKGGRTWPPSAPWKTTETSLVVSPRGCWAWPARRHKLRFVATSGGADSGHKFAKPMCATPLEDPPVRTSISDGPWETYGAYCPRPSTPAPGLAPTNIAPNTLLRLGNRQRGGRAGDFKTRCKQFEVCSRLWAKHGRTNSKWSETPATNTGNTCFDASAKPARWCRSTPRPLGGDRGLIGCTGRDPEPAARWVVASAAVSALPVGADAPKPFQEASLSRTPIRTTPDDCRRLLATALTWNLHYTTPRSTELIDARSDRTGCSKEFSPRGAEEDNAQRKNEALRCFGGRPLAPKRSQSRDKDQPRDRATRSNAPSHRTPAVPRPAVPERLSLRAAACLRSYEAGGLPM